MYSAEGIDPLATVRREQANLLASLIDSGAFTDDAVSLGSIPLIRSC